MLIISLKDQVYSVSSHDASSFGLPGFVGYTASANRIKGQVDAGQPQNDRNTCRGKKDPELGLILEFRTKQFNRGMYKSN